MKETPLKIPLTPGPLVVVVKDTWPPTKPTAVETIAVIITIVAEFSIENVDEMSFFAGKLSNVRSSRPPSCRLKTAPLYYSVQ
jgi:hypothetical protein